jgi:hypothetical protein
MLAFAAKPSPLNWAAPPEEPYPLEGRTSGWTPKVVDATTSGTEMTIVTLFETDPRTYPALESGSNPAATGYTPAESFATIV